MRIVDEVLQTRKACAAEFGKKDKLAVSPARRPGVLTRAGARLDSGKVGGLGDADVIRSARGRATGDAIRSLVISDNLLGTKEWFVIHHANCGVELFTNEVMSGLETAALNNSGFKDGGAGSSEGEYIEWLTIKDHPQNLGDVTIRRLNQVAV